LLVVMHYGEYISYESKMVKLICYDHYMNL